MPDLLGTDIRHAAALIRQGRLVAFPTETVYGLGANALDATAVAGLFEAKERPSFDPIIVHIAERSWWGRVAAAVPEVAERLAARFWPGPLTLVLEKTPDVPDIVTSGLPTVGVRVPDHPVALELLRHADVPIAAPSANRFGRLSPTTPEHVAEQLADRIDYILTAGPCRVGVESTVLQCAFPNTASSPRPVLLRPGGLPVEEIESVIGPVEIPPPEPQTGDAPQLAPGTLAQHYAPSTPLVVGRPDPRLESRAGLLTLAPVADTSVFSAVEVLSSTGNLTEAAANFFAALRRLDALQLDVIVADLYPDEGLGRALNDRLRRAARR